MAQNLTRFTLTMVVLGILLALAIFEPEIFPITLPGTEAPKETPQDFEKRLAELDELETVLAEREAALGDREEELNEHQAALDTREKALSQWETVLNGREAALNRLQAELGALRAALEDQLKIPAAIEPSTPSSPGQKSNPADEQRQEGCLRLAIVAAVVSSLMAGFSMLALVTVARKSSQQPGNGVSQPQGSQARSREQGHYGRGVVGTMRQSPNKGNGRTRTA